MKDHDSRRPIAGSGAVSAHAVSEPSAVGTLSQLPPVDLVRGLAVLDRRHLSGVDLRHVLAAEARLLAWVQAGMAATVNELTLCPPTSRVANARTDEPQEFAVEEVALILRVSPGTAGRIVDAAYDAVVRHPGLWQAWRDGEVDARKVAVVGRVTSSSTAEQAAAVDRILLDRTAPAAGGWSAWEETVRQPPRSLQHRAEVALGNRCRCGAGAKGVGSPTSATRRWGNRRRPGCRVPRLRPADRGRRGGVPAGRRDRAASSVLVMTGCWISCEARVHRPLAGQRAAGGRFPQCSSTGQRWPGCRSGGVGRGVGRRGGLAESRPDR